MSNGEWDGAQFFKSGVSNDVGCVEVTFHNGRIGVRDTKDRSKAPHAFTPHEWECFIQGVKNGEFDLPGQ
jgi:hypothetical protein